MAVISVSERQIVEVNFPFPNGVKAKHPALVLSPERLSGSDEGIFYAVLISSKNHHPEYTMEIPNDWLNTSMNKHSFFVTHLVTYFHVDEISKTNGTYIKEEYFPRILEKVVHSIFDIDMELE